VNRKPDGEAGGDGSDFIGDGGRDSISRMMRFFLRYFALFYPMSLLFSPLRLRSLRRS
jgi:hypothetical protein